MAGAKACPFQPYTIMGGVDYNKNFSGDYTSIYPYGGFYKFTLEHHNGKPDKVIYAGSVITSEYKERCIVVNIKIGDAPHIKNANLKPLHKNNYIKTIATKTHSVLVAIPIYQTTSS